MPDLLAPVLALIRAALRTSTLGEGRVRQRDWAWLVPHGIGGAMPLVNDSRMMRKIGRRFCAISFIHCQAPFLGK